MRVLEFISLGTDKRLIDPTPDKKWLRRKALMMGLTLMPKEINLPSMPDGFIFDISNLHNMDAQCAQGLQKPIFDYPHGGQVMCESETR